MKYALIGCGRIATNHVKAVVNNDLEFVAACDLLPEAIESLLAKHGLETDETIELSEIVISNKEDNESDFNTSNLLVVDGTLHAKRCISRFS